MVTIKNGDFEVRVQNNQFMAIQDTSDGMYFKFKDGSELRILCPPGVEVQTAAKVLMNSTAKDIVLDFDSRPLIKILN